MGAIGGIINVDGAPVEAGRLEVMQDALAIYGADAQSMQICGPVGMTSCRLIVTSEDRHDRQPLGSHENGAIGLLAFDGRLDNRDELKAWLGLDSVTLDQMADSALAQAALVKEHERALPRLLGDFAMAWWDKREQRLCLARDPTGVRPLFWARRGPMLAFASMPVGLLALPGVPVAINETTLHAFLMALPAPPEASFFEGVHKVQSGELVQLDRTGARKRWFHRFGGQGTLRLRDPRDYVEAAREQLQRAVRRRLRSAGPVASHLSSGLDSTTVTVVAARELAERNEPLVAYTASPSPAHDGSAPPGRHADEWEGAASVVASLENVDHMRIFTDEYSLTRSCMSDVAALNQPAFSASDMLWDHAIRQHAQRTGIRTLLSSHAGDLTISYEGGAYPAALLGTGRWLTLLRHAWEIWRRGGREELARLPRAIFLPHYLKLKHALQVDQRVKNWPWRRRTPASDAFLQRIDSDAKIRQFLCGLPPYRPWRIDNNEQVRYFNKIDAGAYFALDNCFGVERRDPTADRRLIEFYLSLPPDLYQRSGQKAWLLKAMMSGWLPDEILYAHSTGCQAADWYLSVQRDRDAIREIFSEVQVNGVADQYIDTAHLITAVNELPSSAAWHNGQVTRKWRAQLLDGLSVACFMRCVERMHGLTE